MTVELWEIYGNWDKACAASLLFFLGAVYRVFVGNCLCENWRILVYTKKRNEVFAMKETNEERKDFCRLPLDEFCTAVSKPGIPSPMGGAVVGAVGAMIASLAQLVVQVSSSKMGDQWQPVVTEAQELHEKFLRFANEDIYEAERLIRGDKPECARKMIAAPAKIASGLVKLLQLILPVAGQMKKMVGADVAVVAHLGHGAADAIFDIEYANIMWSGDKDPALLARIEEWRTLAHEAADQILQKVRNS